MGLDYPLELTRDNGPVGFPTKYTYNGELLLPLYHHRMWFEIYLSFNLTLMHEVGTNSALSPLKY